MTPKVSFKYRFYVWALRFMNFLMRPWMGINRRVEIDEMLKEAKERGL